MIEVTNRETGADEMTQVMPFIPEELETSGAFSGEAPDPGRIIPEIPWKNPNFIACHRQGSTPSIGQEPNGGGADLVVGDDESRFPYFWEIGPDLPQTPEIPLLPLAEPEVLESRSSEKEAKLENFSNLTHLDEELGIIEAQHVETPREGRNAVWKARAEVILAIKQALLSRFTLGKTLAAYRNYFKVERGWMEAANAIAYSMHCCEKTVRNAISDYEQLSAALPAEVIDAAELRGVDLARKRFLPAVKSVEGTINPNGFVSEEQASKVVDNIIAFKSADKTAKPPKPMPSIEDFADRMASFFEKLLNGASPEVREAEARFVLEYVNARLRTSIRELRQYGRPTLVPNPATRKEEMA